MAEQLDQNVVAMMKALAQHESGNKAVLPQEKGIGGASIYQYTTDTWKGTAQKFLGDANAPLNRANENKATYYKIKEWKDKGFKPAQIASMWNAGEGQPDAYTGKFKNGSPSIGVNSYGVKYNVPAHAKSVLSKFQNEIAKLPQATVASAPIPTPQVQEEPKKGFLQKVGSGAVKLGKDIARSTVEAVVRPLSENIFGEIDPTGAMRSSIKQTTGLELPKSTKIPFLGETKLQYSKPTLTDVATNALQGKKTDLKTAETAKEVGADVLGILPTGKATKSAAQIAEESARGFTGKLYKSAFKITENDLKKKPELIKDFISERISGISARSVASKADATVNALETKLDDLIQTATKEGKTISKDAVVKATDDLVKFYENSLFPEYAQVVKSKVAQFAKRGAITVKEAQELKKNTYQILRKEYGKLSGPDSEASKQLARGLKEEIERVIPEVKDAAINKKLAIYGKARDLMERQINKGGRNELIPFKDVVLYGTTQQIWPSVVRFTVESVPFKTYVGRVLSSKGLQGLKNTAKMSAPIVKSLFNSKKP